MPLLPSRSVRRCSTALLLLAAAVLTSDAAQHLLVAKDGSGTHRTVQSAVDAAPERSASPVVIVIQPGRYEEHVHVPKSKPFIVLRGAADDPAQTVITSRTNLKSVDAAGRKISTRDSATVLVQATDFAAENLTFENTTTRDEKVQALAMYVDGDRAAFRRCRFVGWQDTLRPEKGRQYFVDCEISGHVDFIYGAGTALFERCHIHCRADGYITAASTPADSPFGFVFLDCRVTAAPEVEKGFYLGRPWRPYAATAFIRTELPKRVRAEGWHNWGNSENESSARYSEFGSTGPGGSTAARVQWARALAAQEAATYTPEAILKGSDEWNPLRALAP